MKFEKFSDGNHFTLGVELELRILDKFDLTPRNEYDYILNNINQKYKRHLAREFLGSMIEINTPIFHYEKDLIKFSSQFLANNANPFCVGINQIFHILKKDNFECIVEHDNLNYVKIVEKLETQNKEEEDNIIQFRT